jgi:hypothetical protein
MTILRSLIGSIRKLGRHLLLAFGLLFALSAQGRAQALVQDDSNIPYDPAITSDVEFGDIDLDGDCDVLLGNGDQDWARQNAIWINQGGLQGSETGLFLDDTAARLPQVQATTLDLCLGDIDGDGDFDLHVSNSSYHFPVWGNLWWVNVGGKQGGALGYFADETSSRWIGLGLPGSSVSPAMLKDGTFLDDCRNSELADLDNDGDPRSHPFDLLVRCPQPTLALVSQRRGRPLRRAQSSGGHDAWRHFDARSARCVV